MTHLRHPTRTGKKDLMFLIFLKVKKKKKSKFKNPKPFMPLLNGF